MHGRGVARGTRGSVASMRAQPTLCGGPGGRKIARRSGHWLPCRRAAAHRSPPHASASATCTQPAIETSRLTHARLFSPARLGAPGVAASRRWATTAAAADERSGKGRFWRGSTGSPPSRILYHACTTFDALSQFPL
eukprot:94638-Chlamydomonas_euryale.AAC.1